MIKCANAKFFFVYPGLICIFRLYSEIACDTVVRTFCLSFSLCPH